MVYARGPYRRPVARRRPGARYRGANRFRNYRRGVTQLARDVIALRGMLNTEYKVTDLYLAPGAISPTTTGVMSLQPLPGQGLDKSDRIGRQIRLKYFNARVTFTLNAAATATRVRLMFFVDRQSNSGTPALADLITTNDVLAFRNVDYKKRFYVIHDKVYYLNTDFPEKQINIYKKLGFKIKFDGTSNALSDVATNPIWMFAISDEAVNSPVFSYRSRLGFIDN